MAPGRVAPTCASIFSPLLLVCVGVVDLFLRCTALRSQQAKVDRSAEGATDASEAVTVDGVSQVQAAPALQQRGGRLRYLGLTPPLSALGVGTAPHSAASCAWCARRAAYRRLADVLASGIHRNARRADSCVLTVSIFSTSLSPWKLVRLTCLCARKSRRGPTALPPSLAPTPPPSTFYRHHPIYATETRASTHRRLSTCIVLIGLSHHPPPTPPPPTSPSAFTPVRAAPLAGRLLCGAPPPLPSSLFPLPHPRRHTQA